VWGTIGALVGDSDGVPVGSGEGGEEGNLVGLEEGSLVCGTIRAPVGDSDGVTRLVTTITGNLNCPTTGKFRIAIARAVPTRANGSVRVGSISVFVQ
jgi:hypothetical protein